ncbi:hypothetical protein ACFFRR_003018 [Megaselia abdita]
MKAVIIITLLLCAYCHQASSLTTFRVVKRGPVTDLDDKSKQVTSELEVDPNVGPEAPSSPTAEAADPSENEVDQIVEEEVAAEAEAVSEVAEAAEAVAELAPAAPVTEEPVNVDDQNPINKYCKCSEDHCDCCRNFALPIIPVRGPGCARISYLGNEKMSVQIKYGDIVLASRTVSGKNARPICVGLPGGYSKFCGRVYGLSKTKDNFKACLGLELRAEDEVEAALRVSCFKFGPGGLKVAEAEPLPVPPKDEDDDDDDDDFFGLGGGDDGDDEEDDADDDDEAYDDADADTDTDDYDDAADDGTESDYGGIGGFAADLFEDDDDDSAEASAPVVPAASRNDPETAVDADIAGDSTTIKPKEKKNKKKKKNVEEEGILYEILSGILKYFS